MTSTRRVVRLALVGLFLLALPSGAGAADRTVEIKNFLYAPNETTAAAGDSITWVNSDTAPHNAVARDGSWRTPILQPGQRSRVEFDTVGEYAFYCTLHPGMVGTVTVVAAALPATDTASKVPPASPPMSWATLAVIAVATVGGFVAILARTASGRRRGSGGGEDVARLTE